MKKVLLSILTVIYMTVSSGVAMDIHFCMGKRAGADLFESSSDKCGRCGMKEDKTGCCRDEHKFYKLDNAHKNVFNDYNAAIFSPDLLDPASPLVYSLLPATVSVPNRTEAPPADTGPPLFILNCVFLI